MRFGELMDAFAAKAGIEGFAPDEDGNYGLEVDGIELGFAETGDGQMLVTGDVCAAPGDGGRLHRLLLEAMGDDSTTGGAMFSSDPDTGRICLWRTESIAEMDADAFDERIGGFVEIVGEWRGIAAAISAIAPALDAAAAAAADESHRLGLGLPGVTVG